MRFGPMVIFGTTFLVWILAKGEIGTYWGFATTANPKGTLSAQFFPNTAASLASKSTVNAMQGTTGTSDFQSALSGVEASAVGGVGTP